MPNSTALLVMDVQEGIVSRFANDPNLLTSLQTAIAAARRADMPVIYVVVKFREGYPEVSRRNKSFAALAQGNFNFTEGEESVQVHSSVATQPGEVLVTKRRVGAFSGSDLDVVLRAKGINHMVLTGIATSGVVLSTLRAAADLDYQLTVLSDCCADGDEEVHRVLLTKVFPRQADVMTVEEWKAKLPD